MKWEHLDRDHNILFPSDFRDFARLYGAGLIGDYISVSVPDSGNRFVDLLQKSRDFVATLYGVRETLPTRMSYTLEPRGGGLIMWAANEDGDLCFWIVEGEDPDLWRVGIYSRNLNNWSEYSCGFVEFLVGVLSGAVESPFYRSDFPSKPITFKTWRTHLDELFAEN
ncbi:hypothetical protein [Streptomyces broussonetiae]|uniref:SMI1/KNR4 family protein n=1 Tax=Streptomyces broussonetiae TaxID=2686304 RepID=A0ABV5EMH5_9ACTN